MKWIFRTVLLLSGPGLVGSVRLSGAQLPASLQPRIEPFEQFRVELRRQCVAECRQDVEADQILVALARGVLDLGDVEPLLDGLPDGDLRLGVVVPVDLSLQLRERDLCRVVAGHCPAEVPGLAGQLVGAGERHRASRPAGPLFDVAAAAPTWRRHVEQDGAGSSHDFEELPLTWEYSQVSGCSPDGI